MTLPASSGSRAADSAGSVSAASGRARAGSATGMISSTGRWAREACSWIASGLVAWYTQTVPTGPPPSSRT